MISLPNVRVFYFYINPSFFSDIKSNSSVPVEVSVCPVPTCSLWEEDLFCKNPVTNQPRMWWTQSCDQFYISLWIVVATWAPELLQNVEFQRQGIVWERETCALCWGCKAAAALLIKTYVLYISVCLSVALFLMKFLDKGSFSNYASASWCSPSLFIFAIMPFFNFWEQIRPYQSFRVY